MRIPFLTELSGHKSGSGKSASAANSHSNMDDIAELLKTYQHDHFEISGSFRNAQQQRVNFNSHIIQVNEEIKTLTLDSLHPETANIQLVPNTTVDFLVAHLGMRAEFNCKHIESNVSPTLHILAFPKKIEHVQLRGAFRIHINPNANLGVQLSNKDVENDAQNLHEDDSYTGIIVDLSATGARLQLDGLLNPGLTPETIFQTCSLMLSDNQQIQSGAQLIHRHYDKINDVTVLGIHFVGMNASSEQKLTRFLTDLQRRIRNPES